MLARLSPRTERLAGAIALFVLPFALYLPHLGGRFYWDDLHLVRDHPLLHAKDGYWRVFATELLEGAGYPKTQFYHPIPLLSLWLQYRISDAIAWLRFANVAFHALNVVLFARVLERLGLKRATILVLAAAFAIHPLAVEPVMLICGRHDTIAVTFALLALCTQPFDGEPVTPRRALGRSAVVALSVLLAFISKEALVAAAPIAVVFMALSARLGKTPRSLALLCAAPVVGLLGAFAIRRAIGISAASDQIQAPLRDHAVNLGSILGEYSRYILTFSHGTTTRIFVPYGFGGAAAVLALAAAAFALATWSSRPGLRDRGGWSAPSRVLFGLLWATLSLGPHILSMPVLGMWGNRYGYFPSMGLLLCIGSIAEVALERWPRARLGAAALALMALGVVWRTEVFARAWYDGVSLFAADVAAEPENPLAHYHLGVETERLYGCERAVGSFQEAARLAPQYWRAVHNVGGCLIRLKRYEEAIKPARRAVTLDPNSRTSLENLALAQLRGGKPEAAQTTIARGLQRFPESRVLAELAREAGMIGP